ncbi:MAG: LPXTG cell wall anchor domain-containing protein, partial [Collinsella sp.]|nr:LPXTG cell wall anchor domain-containing protein [Collinsella sp.]
DGKPLTNHKVTVGEATWGPGWVDGHGATYSFTGSQKIVGSSGNAFECIPNEGTNLDNYEITKQYGTLSVTDRSEKYQITLTPHSKSVTYDGTEKSVSGFETLEFHINGQTFYVSGVEASATGTDAGEYPVKVSGQAVVIDSDGNDVTGQFTVNIDDALVTIVGVDSDKSASNLPHTGDSAALYAMGICGVAIAAGAGALFTFRKRNNYK